MPFIKIEEPTSVPIQDLSKSYQKQNEHLTLLRYAFSQKEDVDLIVRMSNTELEISTNSVLEFGGALFHAREVTRIIDTASAGVCYVKIKMDGAILKAYTTNNFDGVFDSELKGYYSTENSELVKYLCVSILKKGNDFETPIKWHPLDTQAPAGLIQMFAGDLNKIPAGWLYCNGDPISRVGYKKLFDTIGVAWGEGDGSNTFNLPDCRGGFARGVGQGDLKNPNKADRLVSKKGANGGDKVGSIEEDATRTHQHTQTLKTYTANLKKVGGLNSTWVPDSSGGGGGPDGGGGGGGGYWQTETGVDAVASLSETTTYPVLYLGGSETRPCNFAVNFIVKY